MEHSTILTIVEDWRKMELMSVKVLVAFILFYLASYFFGGFTFPYLREKFLPKTKEDAPQITVPTDLVKISGCIPFEGEHWVRPSEFEHGPYYIMYNGELNALEYMFSPEEIAGKKYAKMGLEELAIYMKDNKKEWRDIVDDIRSFNFNTNGIQVKYFDMHWTHPHPGVIEPHYDMHLYLKDKAYMDTVCPDSSLEDLAPASVIEGIMKAKIPLPGMPAQ